MKDVLIIDDEQHCIDRLLKLIKDHTDFNLLTTCMSVEDGIAAINKYNPDLVFLDIQIHDKTGFDLLRSLPSVNFQVIFATAYENFAIKAFKFSALDYLLKPVDTDDFINAIKRYNETNVSQHQVEKQINVLFNNLNKKNPLSKISIPTMDGLEVVDVNDIIYFHSDQGCTTVYTEKSTIIVSKILKYFEEILSQSGFYRVHNSDLINLNYVKKYTKGSGGYVTLLNNKTINVSARRKDGLMKLLSN